jgi:hypothetical protein
MREPADQQDDGKQLNRLAVALTVVAVGTALFWIVWFASGSFRNASPEDFRLWENTFPLPDGIMAILMVTTAVDVWRRGERALLWGAMSAGMALYLAAVDLGYHYQAGNLRDWMAPSTWMRGGIIVIMLVVSVQTVRTLRRNRAALWSTRPTAGKGRILGLLAALFMIYALAVSLYWLAIGAIGYGNEYIFTASFEFTDWISVVLALVAAWGCSQHRPIGYWAGVLMLSGLAFGSLNFAGFYFQTAIHQGQSPALPVAVCLSCAIVAWAGVFTLWWQRGTLRVTPEPTEAK